MSYQRYCERCEITKIASKRATPHFWCGNCTTDYASDYRQEQCRRRSAKYRAKVAQKLSEKAARFNKITTKEDAIMKMCEMNPGLNPISLRKEPAFIIFGSLASMIKNGVPGQKKET